MKQIPQKKKVVTLLIIGAMFLFLILTISFFGLSGIRAVFDFITSQVLGMKWLNDIIGMLIKVIATNFFNDLTILDKWYGASIQFFLYDTIKIISLLCILIFTISYIQSFFPPERTKKILSKFNGVKGNIFGALLGTVTPFCSCSSIPLFIGFTRAGIRSGVTFSFLISSPLVDLGAFILLASVFGFPIALSYVLVGLLLAIIGGTIIEATGVGDNIEEFVLNGNSVDIEELAMTRKDRLIYAMEQMISTLKKVWIYILIGVGIGAMIHNVIPASWIESVLGNDFYSVLVSVGVGVPMYADIFGTIPIAEALFAKGIGVGTILAFMMSVTALSLPSLILLRKVVKPKLLLSFFLIVVSGIIIIGYVFNAINYLFI